MWEKTRLAGNVLIVTAISHTKVGNTKEENVVRQVGLENQNEAGK